MRFSTRYPLTQSQFWRAFIPSVLLTALLVFGFYRFYIGFLYHSPDLNQVLSAYQGSNTIKPGLILSYLSLLIFWPLSMLFFSISRSGENSQKMEVAAQIAVSCFLLFNLGYQEFYAHYYFKSRWFAVLILFAGLVYLLPRWRLQSKSGEKQVRVLVFFLTVLSLLPCLFTEANFGALHERIAWHLPFVIEEFAAVFNGLTSLVDFYPMYSQLLPYGLTPFFKLFGFSIASFTAAMAILSSVCIFSGYSILKRVSPGPWVTFFLFLGWYGMFVRPLEGAGAIRYSTFSYFALGPLRYFGFWTVAALTLRVVNGRMRFGSQFFCVLWAGFAAINNLDLGLPALFACITLLLISTQKIKQSLLAVILGLTVSCGLSLSIPLLRTGQFPRIGEFLSFQIAAGRYGFAALPTPALGMHWVVLAGLLSALTVALAYFFNRKTSVAAHRSEIDPLMQALFFFGIAGSGAFVYFVNRSHWQVLQAFATVGVFPFLLLSVLVLFRTERPMTRSIPALICIAVFSGSFSFLNFIPNPFDHVYRILGDHRNLARAQERFVDLVRKNSSASESVFVVYPFGHSIAMRAGVKNTFPYSTSESVVLKSHLENVTHVIQSQNIKKIFGRLPVELLEWVEKNGFSKTQTVDDFSIWTQP